MRAIIQNSLKSSVVIDGEMVGAIDKGLVVLLGVTHDDTIEDVNYLARKIAKLRIFEDNDGKTNLDILDIQGEILSISQFTLYANSKKGNRPSFVRAASPDKANQLYEAFNKALEAEGLIVKTGVFGADMKVNITNNGPMTIILDSVIKDL